jgi:hypothetical protein
MPFTIIAYGGKKAIRTAANIRNESLDTVNLLKFFIKTFTKINIKRRLHINLYLLLKINKKIIKEYFSLL